MKAPAPRRVLELFSGTGSIGKWCRANGFDEVVSVDIDPKSNATHVCDVMNFDYKIYPPGYFEIAWGSPPCVHFSCARTTGPPHDLEGADRLVLKTIEIITYLKPRHWFIESPATGLLKTRPYMQMYNSVRAAYCMYSSENDSFLWRKLTQFWTNRVELLANPPLVCNGACEGIRTPVPGAPVGRKTHAISFGGQRGGKRFYLVSNLTLDRKHKIPQKLIEKLLVG